MSQDLFSPLNCNICLMLQTTNKSETEQQNDASSITSKRQLMTCNGCHMVKYCNKSHQMIDWNIHRDFCRAIQKIKQTLKISHPMLVSGESPKCKEDIEKTILQLKYLLKNTLGRPLEFQEEELTSFPVYCPICFRIRKVNVLCMSCKNQAYCSAEHLEKHKMEHMKVCGLLQMYYTPYKTVPPENCLELAIKKRVDSLQNLDLVQAFEQAFQCKLPDEPTISLLDYQKFAYAANFSCIFTICYALCHVDMRSYGADTKFVIFIIGASVEAVLWFQEIHCKIFFQQYPEFKELDLVFIGPDVADAPHQVLIFDTMDTQRKVYFHCYRGLFQNYCQHFKVKPSIIVAFNCGFSEFTQNYNSAPHITTCNSLVPLERTPSDTWYFGLIEMLQTYDTPIIFTSFTKQEADFDFSALEKVARQRLKINIERIFKTRNNPYRDIRPLRQWYVRDQESIYYRNNIIQAIRTK